MIKEKPNLLYKYRPINRHTINMILANEAYFSLPIDFNDPFDCNTIPKLIYSREEQVKFLTNLKYDGRITEDDFLGLLNNPEKIFDLNWKVTFENLRSGIRIFCLSTVNNNVMMFSHYAESHKGICLEFLVLNDPFFDYLDYVRYTENIPIFHPFNEDISLIQKELVEIEILTKSCSWGYENEWRIIKSGPDPFLIKFSPNILSSIIFGYQTPTEDKLLIERIVERREPSIQLKEAIKKDKSFELEIVPYKF